jgi:hypothetical protein
LVYRLDDRTVAMSPVGTRDYYFSLHYSVQNRLWGPLNLLPNRDGYWGLLPPSIGRGHEDDRASSAEIRNAWIYIFVPQSVFGVQRQILPSLLQMPNRDRVSHALSSAGHSKGQPFASSGKMDVYIVPFNSRTSFCFAILQVALT